MRTIELLRTFKESPCSLPDEPWERFVWEAANLLLLAEIERKTVRKRNVVQKEDIRQMMLFE